MLRIIKKFKKYLQFKKDMKSWVRLCKCKPMSKLLGIDKVGELTHTISIDGIGEISTRDPMLVKPIIKEKLKHE